MYNQGVREVHPRRNKSFEVTMEAISEAEQKLSTFISQLLTGVVESVHQQGYQVAFLASKFGDGSNDILSLHGGLSLNIQKQIEINFKNLIKEAAHNRDCSISQSREETIPSNHTASIEITDVLASTSSSGDLTPNTRTVMESAAHVDTIKVECGSEIDCSFTGDAEIWPMTDVHAEEQEEYNGDERVNEGPKQEYGPPNDIQIDHDDSPTESISKPEEPSTATSTETTATPANLSYEHFRGKKKCKYGEYSTRHKSMMIRHTSKHNGERQFACTQCPYRCNQRSSLKKHILTHTGEKPLSCPECPYRSTNSSNMNTHMRKHTGEKPHACPKCPYRTLQLANLERHMLTHTGEKPFACPECPYRCNQQSSLKRHMQRHTRAEISLRSIKETGEKPFDCPKCPFRCNHQSSLRRYMQRPTRAEISWRSIKELEAL